jgi:hypothetical protein
MARRIGIAAALFLLLLAGFLVLRARERWRGASEREASSFLRFDDRQVTGLTVTFQGVDWKMLREASAWTIVAPLSEAADVEAVQGILRACRRATVQRVIEEPEALSSYGLDPPRARIRLEGVGLPAVDVGNEAPAGQGIFARVGGRPGVLVLDPLEGGGLLLAEPARFRDRALVRVSASEVGALEVRSRNGRLRARKEPDGWWIELPRRLPASELEVERLLRGVQTARVRDFGDGLDPRDAALGLGQGALELELETTSGRRILRFGAATEEGVRYVKRDDRATVLLVEAGSLPEIPTSVEALRERKLTKVNRYAVARFEYRRGGRTVSAARAKGGPWTGLAGERFEAGAVSEFLSKVLEAPTVGWTQAPPPGPPQAVLDFELEDGGRDRVDFYSNGTARVGSLPGVLFRVASKPPEPPPFGSSSPVR